MLLHHSGLKRYWKILLVVMVITCESIEFITRGLRPLVIISILSLVITITTRNIFQYLLPGVVQLLIPLYANPIVATSSMIKSIASAENIISDEPSYIKKIFH